MKKNIFTSFMIISVGSVLDRTLGFLFKIYLSRELGAQNMGVYQIVSGVFFALLTFIASGIPLTLSKSVSAHLSVGDNKGAGKVTCSALIIGLAFSLILTLATLAFLPLLNAYIGEKATLSLLATLPALFFSAVYSALRGNLWGREKYFSVALVEIIEQVSRILSCVIAFSLGANKLIACSLSTSIGCAVSAFACVLFFKAYGLTLRSPKGKTRRLFISQLPVTLSRSLGTLLSSALSIAVPALFISSGYCREQAMELYGASMGMALPLLYTPMTVIGALAFVLVPSFGGADKTGYTKINQKITASLCAAQAIACSFIPIFYGCGQLIGEIVYNSAISGRFMSISSWVILPLSLRAISTSVMNALDCEGKGFINCLIASLVQAIFFLLMKNGFTLQVLALGIGLEVAVACALNILAITGKTGLNCDWLVGLLKCAVATIACCLVCKSLSGALICILSPFFSALISSGVAFACFILLVLALDAIKLQQFLVVKAEGA